MVSLYKKRYIVTYKGASHSKFVLVKTDTNDINFLEASNYAIAAKPHRPYILATEFPKSPWPRVWAFLFSEVVCCGLLEKRSHSSLSLSTHRAERQGGGRFWSKTTTTTTNTAACRYFYEPGCPVPPAAAGAGTAAAGAVPAAVGVACCCGSTMNG